MSLKKSSVTSEAFEVLVRVNSKLAVRSGLNNEGSEKAVLGLFATSSTRITCQDLLATVA
jgi:hypothetical protein